LLISGCQPTGSRCAGEWPRGGDAGIGARRHIGIDDTAEGALIYRVTGFTDAPRTDEPVACRTPVETARADDGFKQIGRLTGLPAPAPAGVDVTNSAAMR